MVKYTATHSIWMRPPAGGEMNNEYGEIAETQASFEASYRCLSTLTLKETMSVLRRMIFFASLFFSMPSVLSAQIRHGQKPKLTAPFATRSAGNGPKRTEPPAGVLPTVPAGVRVKLDASDPTTAHRAGGAP